MRPETAIDPTRDTGIADEDRRPMAQLRPAKPDEEPAGGPTGDLTPRQMAELINAPGLGAPPDPTRGEARGSTLSTEVARANYDADPRVQILRGLAKTLAEDLGGEATRRRRRRARWKARFAGPFCHLLWLLSVPKTTVTFAVGMVISVTVYTFVYRRSLRAHERLRLPGARRVK